MPRTRIWPLAMLLALLAPAAPAGAAASRGFVLTTDYVTGTLGVVDLATRAVTPDVARVSSDPVARWYRGLLYVVNRYGHDNVQVIDPARGHATARQFSVGNGSNPQDIAFASPTKAYVSRLGSPDLLVVDPSTGAALGVVPLAAWADADGNPEAARMAVVGDLLFVALGRLASFLPADTGLVAVVDMRADTVLDVDPDRAGVQAVKLAGLNPGTDFARPAAGAPGEPAHLWIGCSGRWGEWDGGVDDIVIPAGGPAPGAPIRSAGFLVTEAALGGDLLDVDAAANGRAYAVVSDLGYNTSLVAWDPATGTLLHTLAAPGGYGLTSASLDDRGELYACNSSFTAPGLTVYSTVDDALLAGPLATGLPPVQVVFDEGEPAVPAEPAGEGPSLADPAPNPARETARLEIRLPGPGPVRVEILDVSGRRLRCLADGPFGTGATPLDWDLADRDGRRVPAGVYLVRAVAPGATLTRRIVVL